MTTTDTALEQVTESLRAVVRQQAADLDPAHEDFYTWGWALSDLTAYTQDAGRVLMRQVAAYGDRRLLRDDDDADPNERLLEARRFLDQMAAALAEANVAARAFHSSIGHIAVAVDPEAQG